MHSAHLNLETSIKPEKAICEETAVQQKVWAVSKAQHVSPGLATMKKGKSASSTQSQIVLLGKFPFAFFWFLSPTLESKDVDTCISAA